MTGKPPEPMARARLDGKVCVVTGAAGVIGTETVRVFRREGATVVGVDIQGTSDADLFVQADLTSSADVDRLYAEVRSRFGRVDVLFNNAGIALPDDGSVLDTDLEAWNRVLAANVTSVFLCCKYGIPHLLEGGGDRWSTLRHLSPTPDRPSRRSRTPLRRGRCWQCLAKWASSSPSEASG